MNATRLRPSRAAILRLSVATLVVLFYELFLLLSPMLKGNDLASTPAIHFIDVGQGDSTLIVLGTDHILIDAGEVEMGHTVVTYLNDLGITHLTAVIATHPHSDHIGGLPTVLHNITADTLYVTGQTTSTMIYQTLLDTAESANIPVKVPTPGQTLSLSNGAVLTFLSPSSNASFDNLNNASLVCMLEAYGKCALFMGDAEQPIEQDLLDTDTLPHVCDVLKVGHHGSDTSSSEPFLSAIQPSTAVISCALYNDYGHPSPIVLDRFAAHDTEIHITAKEGTYIYPLPHIEGENFS